MSHRLWRAGAIIVCAALTCSSAAEPAAEVLRAEPGYLQMERTLTVRDPAAGPQAGVALGGSILLAAFVAEPAGCRVVDWGKVEAMATLADGTPLRRTEPGLEDSQTCQADSRDASEGWTALSSWELPDARLHGDVNFSCTAEAIVADRELLITDIADLEPGERRLPGWAATLGIARDGEHLLLSWPEREDVVHGGPLVDVQLLDAAGQPIGSEDSLTAPRHGLRFPAAAAAATVRVKRYSQLRILRIIIPAVTFRLQP